MRDDKRRLGGEPVDRCRYPAHQRRPPFAAGRWTGIGIVPEVAEHRGIDLGTRQPVPFAEIEFAPARIDRVGQPQVAGDSPSASACPQQVGGQHRRDVELLGLRTARGEPGRRDRGIGAAKQAAGQHRLAVAHQIDRLRAHKLAETLASAKVAMPLCAANAARITDTATAAPLPSPRRMPRFSSGSRPSRARSRQ